MRVLFTTTAGTGHYHPLIPLAWALARAGHDVAFAGPASLAPVIATCGFPLFVAGYDPAGPPDPGLQALQAELGRFRPDFSVGLHTGLELMRFYWSRISAGFMTGKMVPDLMALIRSWRPDLVVRELYELGGAVAAEAAGLPHVAVQVGHIVNPAFFREATHQGVGPLRAALGLPPDPTATMLFRHALLSFVPPSYQEPGEPIPTQHHFWTDPFDRSGPEGLPAWFTPDLPRPIIYTTFGTEPHFTPYPDFFQMVIAGLQGLGGTLIVTTGRGRDPDLLGPLPSHVHAERYVPQSLLVPRCDLVVHHGGHNTTLAALAAGLPQVVIPLGADQPANALRCRALALGEVIWPNARTAASIGMAAHAALATPAYRANARRLRAEMRGLPGVRAAVGLLADLVPAFAAAPAGVTARRAGVP